MTLSLTRLLSKTAAIALTVATGALIYLGAAQPIANHIRGLDDAITTERETLGRYLSIAREDAELATGGMKDAVAMAGAHYLSGDNDAEKTANLQALIKEMASKEGAKFLSSRTVAVKQQGPIRLLGVGAELSADLAELQSVLAAIENARPFLFIETLQITARNPASVSADEGQKSLDVRLEVFGAAPGNVKTGEPSDG